MADGWDQKTKMVFSTEGEGGGGRRTRSCCGGVQPSVTFSTFVFSLGSSALMLLGELPDPQTQHSCRDLTAAKQTIDVLGMLEEKTKGNLDLEEQNLLRTLLYDLRLKYVAAVR
jgi:hypothetical protein